jgi:hypothetical protein
MYGHMSSSQSLVVRVVLCSIVDPSADEMMPPNYAVTSYLA